MLLPWQCKCPFSVAKRSLSSFAWAKKPVGRFEIRGRLRPELDKASTAAILELKLFFVRASYYFLFWVIFPNKREWRASPRLNLTRLNFALTIAFDRQLKTDVLDEWVGVSRLVFVVQGLLGWRRNSCLRSCLMSGNHNSLAVSWGKSKNRCRFLTRLSYFIGCGNLLAKVDNLTSR